MTDFILFEKALDEYNKLENKNTINGNDYNIYDDDDFDDILPEKNVNDECLHKNIINENGVNICYDCGIQTEKTIFQDKEWRFYGNSDNKRNSDPNRVHIRKIDDKSIYKDVENMGFNDKIISLANQIYIEVTKGQIFRGNSRKALVFSCIFHSLKINGKPQSHEKLIKIFDLTKKIGLKGLKYVNLNAPKDSLIHTTYITPVNLIEDIMDKFDATKDQKSEVIKLYTKIKNKSSKINRSRPQSVSAALIYYWISYKNIDICLKDFAKRVELSELTIVKISKEISEILGVIPEVWK